jgi:hypothetical protein
VKEGGSGVFGYGGGVGQGSMYFSDSWSGNDSFSYEGFPVDDGVESVDGIGGVFNGTSGTVRIYKRVASLYNITITSFLLVFAVSGQTVLDVITVGVLWMGVVFVGDYGFGDGDGGSDSGTGKGSGVTERSCETGNWGGGITQRSGNGSSDKASTSGGNDGGEDHELK